MWDSDCQSYGAVRATLSGKLFSTSVLEQFSGQCHVQCCRFDHRYCSHLESEPCESPDIVFEIERGNGSRVYRWQGHVGSISPELPVIFG